MSSVSERSEHKLFWDLETTVKNKGDEAIGDFPASPFHPNNRIVLHQLATDDGDVEVFYDEDTETIKSVMSAMYGMKLAEAGVIVGHNIKFDLLYALRFYEEFHEFLARGGKIYDTMLAEYLISGHYTKYPSLNYCAKKYGGTLKDDRIKEYWDSGFETEDIPRDQLEEYGKYDVINTRIVYEEQQKSIERLGIEALVEANMEALLATTEMEYNGMYFDTEFAKEHLVVLQQEHKEAESNIISTMKEYFNEEFHDKLNPGSPDQLSAVLFGGVYKYTVKKVVLDEDGNPVRYGPKAQKAGQIKTKNVEVRGSTKGLGLEPSSEWSAKKDGLYFTNDDVLTELKNRGINTEFIEDVLKYRELQKDISTYFNGYSELVWQDHCIHGKLNHVQTGTGRLSSSSPNTQNLTKGK